ACPTTAMCWPKVELQLQSSSTTCRKVLRDRSTRIRSLLQTGNHVQYRRDLIVAVNEARRAAIHHERSDIHYPCRRLSQQFLDGGLLACRRIDFVNRRGHVARAVAVQSPSILGPPHQHKIRLQSWYRPRRAAFHGIDAESSGSRARPKNVAPV